MPDDGMNTVDELFPEDVFDILFKDSNSIDDTSGISELNAADVAYIIKELDAIDNKK